MISRTGQDPFGEFIHDALPENARHLDEVLPDKNAAFIEKSIVDPNAEIAKGFSAGIMPQQFGQTLQPAELDALVKYLDEVTG